MKKLIYTLTAIATLAFAAGCANELDGPNPVKGEFVETEFTVALDDATATKAAIGNDAAKIDKLLIRAFKSDGTSLKELDGNFEIDEVTTVGEKKQFGVKAKLVRNFPYKIAFFALHDGAPYTMDDNGVITMAAGAANDENLDVFYKVEDITLDPDTPATLVKTITLTRPLAQINVLSDPADWAAADATGILDGLKSSVTITAPTKLNLVDGTVGTPAELAFTLAESPTGTINVGTAESAVDANYVAMAYILSGTSASPVNVTFHVESANTDFAGFTRTVNNVPNKANFRTNLHGDLFTTTGDFTVVLDPDFGSTDDNQNINIPQPTISQPTSIPAGAALPTVNPGNNVTTSLAAGKLYFGIDSNSDGAITYSSSDHTVGTIDTDGVFTPVGAGTTNITVTQAAGKQTKAIGDPLSEITIVYHVTVEATQYDITFSAGDNGAFTEIKLNGDGVTLTENKISAAKNDVITFQVAPVANYEVDVVKVGDEPLTATEEVYSYTVGEAAATISATFKEMGTVATPVLSPNGGYFKSGDQVTITCETDGAAIYYTTDNEDPSSASSLYEGPINLTTECTIKAIAIKSGMINSAVTDAAHFIPKAATTIEIEASQSLTYGQTLTLTPVLKSGSTTVSDGVSFGYQVSSDIIAVTNAGVVSTTTGTGTPSVTVSATVPDAYLTPENAVVTINLAKAASTLVWNDGALEVTVGGEDLSLAGKYTTTGSPEEVSFVVDDNTVASIMDGNKVHALAAGSITVTATLYGNNNYEAASAEKTITINPAAVVTYAVNIDNAIANGTVTPNKTEAAAGETVTLTINSEEGYELDELTILDGDAQAVTISNTYSFTMPASDVEVGATFKKVKYTVTVGSLSNGSVVADQTSVEWGKAVTLTVTPASGYQLKAGTLSVTGGVTDLTDMADGEGHWMFTMPKSSVTVSAEFEAAQTKTLASIAVTTNPTKTSYIVLDTFDPSGMVVTATYSDNSTAPVTGYTTNASTVLASSSASAKPVTVTYVEEGVEVTTTFDITVNTVTDVLTNSNTINSTGTTYSDWDNKTSSSHAVYAGQSAGQDNTIQLRSKNSNSGVISTSTGGLVKSVKIKFNSQSEESREVWVYGSNSVYESAADLYSTGKQGTKIATIPMSSSDEVIEITDDYKFIGLRSGSGALYIDSIEIVWK